MSAPGPKRRTSERDDWQTPDYVVDGIAQLLRIDGFSVDPCAGANSLISPYGLNLTGPCTADRTGEGSASGRGNCYCGLCAPWSAHNWPYDGSRQYAFVNPPYSQAAAWVHACWEHQQIHDDECPSVLLVPNSTDTHWWHLARQSAQQTIHVRGRISFYHPGHQGVSANTGGSTLFIFDRSLSVIGEGAWDAPKKPKGWAPPSQRQQPPVARLPIPNKWTVAQLADVHAALGIAPERELAGVP